MSIPSELRPRATTITPRFRARSLSSRVAIAISTPILLVLSACSKRQELQAEPASVIPIPSSAVTATTAASSSTPSAPLSAKVAVPRVRDSATLTVDGVLETWRLEWRDAPELACVDEHWWTCPCTGFAFGEQGKLDLVRERGSEIERFDMESVFGEAGEGQLPIVQGWKATKEEEARSWSLDAGVGPSAAELEARPRVKVLVFGDYDHDGAATEFVLQVGTQPCFRTHSVVVGVSRTNRRLHVFRDAKAPESPILFSYKDDWEKVKTKLPARLIEISCGDHGSDEEVTALVTADARGLHVTRQTKRCPP